MKSYNSLTPFIIAATLTAATLTACGGGGGSSSNPVIETAPPPASTAEPILIASGSEASFNNYMQSALRLWGGLSDDSDTLQQDVSQPFPTTSNTVDQAELTGDSLSVSAAESATAFGTSNAITATNTIVSGVDESDAAKYSGEHLYLANGQHLTIVEANETGNGEVIANLRLTDSDYGQLTALHLSDGNVAAIEGGGFFAFFTDIALLPAFGPNEVNVNFVDINSPAAPTVVGEITIDGTLLQSRRIGEVLYLITEYSPYIENYEYFATTDEAQQTNEQLLSETTTEDLMPSYTLNGVTTLLNDPAECLLPNEASSEEFTEPQFPSMLSIVALDMRSGNLLSTSCLLDGLSGIHMTENNLYVASPGRGDDYFASTVIHQFSLAGSETNYVASGPVPGSFWGNPAFLMGESGGQLVVITTERTTEGETDFVHRLTTLTPDDDGVLLEVAGTIPNDTRPERIGKPNEQIFASRIVQDRAYVVTFEQIDPVYAIDLNDLTDPFILGELEIPGFSSYLHPISADLFLGIGSNATEQDGRLFNDGINIRLFNVSDPGDVELVDEILFNNPGTFSSVGFDYHAFTSRYVGDTGFQFALPINRAAEQLSTFSYRWTDTSLHVFSVDDINAPQITTLGNVVAEDHSTGERFQPGCCTWQPRSFFNEDQIFYLNKSRLINSSFTEIGPSSNLFIDTVFTDASNELCPEFQPDPITTWFHNAETGESLSCSITAVPLDEEATDGEPSDDQDNPNDIIEACNEPMVALSPDISGPGAYTMQVSLEGFQTRQYEDIRIQQGQCHLGPTYFTGYLEPLEE